MIDGKTILIAGGTGFIGRHVVNALHADGAHVVVLTRGPTRDVEPWLQERHWDPGKDDGAWAEGLEPVDAVVNLAGASVNGRPTPDHRRLVLESRLQSVRALASGLSRLPGHPPSWIQASAIGYYGERGDHEVDETVAAGDGFFPDVCRQWEEEARRACGPGQRLVIGRIGVVLGREGGAYPVLRRLVKVFLGGSAGHGRQYVSWVHVADVAGMVTAAVSDDSWRGVYNWCAPAPVTNKELMRQLRRSLGRPWSPPAPALFIRLGAAVVGTDPGLVLGSTRVAPRRLREAGFRYRFPELADALADLA